MLDFLLHLFDFGGLFGGGILGFGDFAIDPLLHRFGFRENLHDRIERADIQSPKRRHQKSANDRCGKSPLATKRYPNDFEEIHAVQPIPWRQKEE